MARRPFGREERPRDAHRVNRQIRISPIRVIGPDGEQLGVMSNDEGRAAADEYGLDLVEVAPNSRPPVCRILDYGKYKYELSKKKASSKSDRVEIKTIRLRPKTDDHDLNTKLRKAVAFLDAGNPVKFVMRMRGRENAFADRWIGLMNEFLAHLENVQIKSRPHVEGRAITAIVEPDAP